MCRLDHAALKRDDAAWRTLKLVGVQPSYDGHGTDLEMRNCICNSTLCRPIITQAVIESAERTVARQAGLDYDRADRVWLRAAALELIRAEHNLNDAGVMITERKASNTEAA